MHEIALIEIWLKIILSVITFVISETDKYLRNFSRIFGVSGNQEFVEKCHCRQSIFLIEGIQGRSWIKTKSWLLEVNGWKLQTLKYWNSSATIKDKVFSSKNSLKKKISNLIFFKETKAKQKRI